MSQGNGPDTVLPGDPGQELMANLAGGHFDGKTFIPGKFFHVATFNEALEFEVVSRPLHEPFIGSTAAAPELVIEMRHRQAPPHSAGEGC